MENEIKYFVDDKLLSTTRPELGLDEILASAKASIDQVYLVSKDGVEYLDPREKIEVHSGDRFKTRTREDEQYVTKVIHYTVNGEPQKTEHSTCTLAIVLKSAGSDASINVAELDSYYLENLIDDSKYENLPDEVTIHEGDKFLAVHRGKTPVA